MSYQEKESIISLSSNFLIFSIYYIYIYQMYQEGSIPPSEAFKFWGSAIFILIPVMVVLSITIHIIFAIINKITSSEDDPGFRDELDKIIELKALRNAYYVFLVGFMLSMGSQIIEMSSVAMFSMLFFSWMSAAVFYDSTRIYFYRKGF